MNDILKLLIGEMKDIKKLDKAFSKELFLWYFKIVNGYSKPLISSSPNSCTVSYSYVFNGKENDNEVNGVGNNVDFGQGFMIRELADGCHAMKMKLNIRDLLLIAKPSSKID